ncbi:hypothetical protein WBG78_09900 [Chryseolinea sp. T2]|uniref:hypothetical protein n=1 Tax=Chryseolinea sp. T2 TaxID=3129255 RepID=UPI003078A384
MKRVCSNYKLFGGFGLLIALNGIIGFGAYKLLTSSNISIDKVDLLNDNDARFTYAVILGLLTLFLVLFITQNRFIIASREEIVFINPLIPFLRKKYKWTDFDYYVTVDESSRHASHEAVWLIKNGKLEARFSSFYYSNYDDLLGQISTRNEGGKDFSVFDQLLILLRLKRVKD